MIVNVNQPDGLSEHLTDDWLIERHGRFRAWCKREAKSLQLLARIAGEPERLLAEGEFLKSSRQDPRTDKFRIQFNGGSYFCKRYNRRGLIFALKSLLRTSRAFKSVLAAQSFLRAGVPTPEPLLCLEERHFGVLARTYLFYPYVKGETASFLELWPHLDELQQRACLVALGQIIGHMHRHGLLHGDLNWRNFIAVRQDGAWRFWLVDLDGAGSFRRVSPAMARKDLDHFIRDLDRSGAGADLQKLFLEHWQKQAGLKLPAASG